MLMMNSTKILGDDKPRGGSRVCWNILMGVSVLGALAAALTAVIDKASHPIAGPVVIGIGLILVTLILAGFLFEPRLKESVVDEPAEKGAENPHAEE